MISTLQKLAGIGSTISDNRASTINFNANLPITIEVLKQMDKDRFKLKLGRKELTTKSQKSLKEGKRYWGNFFEGKGGILTISNLTLQPQIFQSDTNFLNIALEPMANFEDWRAFLIQNLLDETTSKESFSTFSHMLVALSKHIIHIPLLREGKKYLIQFKKSNTVHLDEAAIQFYAGFENLGPIKGTITQRQETIEMQIDVLYEKSLHFLQKELHKLDMITHVSLSKDILPLYDLNDLLLDLKG